MSTYTSDDPYGAFRFRLEMDGALVAVFSEVAIVPPEIRAGEPVSGIPSAAPGQPGQSAGQTVVFKRGLTESKSFREWIANSADGQIVTKTLTLRMLNVAGDVAQTWTLLDAFCVAFQGGTMSAKTDEILIESLSVVTDKIDRTA